MRPRPTNSRLILAVLAAGLLVLLILRQSFWHPPPTGESTSPSDFVIAPGRDGGSRSIVVPESEFPEAANPRTIGVFVRDKSGQPVPKAKVTVRMPQWREGWRREDHNSFTTDAFGYAEVSYPVRRADAPEIAAACDEANLGGKSIRWNTASEVPATCTITLGRTTGFGGEVVDENGLSIAGARVEFARFFSDGAEQYQRQAGEQYEVPGGPVTTDGWGRWSMRGFPLALIDRIAITVSHPDFQSRQHDFDLTNSFFDSLPGGVFQTVLRRGSRLQGVVRDEMEKPVPGATLELEGVELQSDAAGKFSFGNGRRGQFELRVSAAGYVREVLPVKIAGDAQEMVITLQQGRIVRGLVQDETGAPLAGVVLNTDTVFERAASSHSSFTDRTGRFNWDRAPAPPPPLNFSHPGHVRLTNVVPQLDVDNVITLRRLDDLEGTVLDDATGEPVRRFWVALRSAFTPEGYSRSAREFTGADGKFKLARTGESDFVWIGSEDHDDCMQPIPAAGNVGPLLLRLKPKPALRGVVLSAAGKPVTGAQVVCAGRQGKETSLKFRGFANDAITTNNRGQFALTPAAASTLIYAATSTGFGQTTCGEIEAGQPLRLQPYGSLKGSLLIAGQPAARKWVQFSTRLPGLRAELFEFMARTDEDGDFTFEALPSGPGAVLPYGENSATDPFDEESLPVQIKPGETSVVTVSDEAYSGTGK